MQYAMFSTDGMKHIPVSSVKPEDSDGCLIAGICVSADGILFAVDSMLHIVYRVDIESGDCSSFGKEALGKFNKIYFLNFIIIISAHPLDVAMWMEYLLVLDKDLVHIFTPMGVRVKSCNVQLPNEPININVIGENVMITEYLGRISVYKIET